MFLEYCSFQRSNPEIDNIWNNSYLPLDAEVSEYCSSKSQLLSGVSRESLLEFSDKWVDALLERLEYTPLESNPSFEPMIFIPMKLHSLAGRLVMKCQDFHATYSPRVIPSLNSILTKCPIILKNFTAIEELVKKRPICPFVQDYITTYRHDDITTDALSKQAKQFQIQYASLSDDIESYLVICRYTKPGLPWMRKIPSISISISMSFLCGYPWISMDIQKPGYPWISMNISKT